MVKIVDANTGRARVRLKIFALHILVYFLIMLTLVPFNIFVYDSSIWVIFPMVGWGSVLAIHAAFVMGLFDHFTSN